MTCLRTNKFNTFLFWQYCCNTETDESSIDNLILYRDYIVAICLSEPYPINVELKLSLLYTIRIRDRENLCLIVLICQAFIKPLFLICKPWNRLQVRM